MTNEVTEWHPPQEKVIHGIVQWGLIGIGALVAAFAIKTFVPTLRDAVALLTDLLQNLTHGAIALGILGATIWLLYEIFSPKGKINGLFAQAYSSFIHNATLELLNVDPMSPLKDALTKAKEKQADYNQKFAMFDGQISKINQNVAMYRDKQNKAETLAKTAQRLGNAQAFSTASADYASDKQTADNLQAMAERLTKIRAVIVRLQTFVATLIHNLEREIESTQIQWDTQKAMTSMERAARGIIANGGKNDLANEAQQIVQSKYAAAFGQLENLETTAMPLLDSMDMNTATFSQELLDKWNAEDSHAPMLTAQVVPMAAMSAPTSAFDNLLGKR